VAGALGADGLAATAATASARPYTNLPDRLNVKIFFTGASGGNYVCSGTIVNSATKRMVSTAGHCVSDGLGRFHSNFIVVPGYSSQCNGCGDAPFGRWSARFVTTTTEWHSFSNFKQDVGYIVTNDRNGVRIVDRLGGQGISFNAARSQLTIRISCNMTGGASGGGWLINQSGGLGFVNGVNSYKYISGPKANSNHMYGPYFGNAALQLFNFTVDQG
jgi:hypothetical protein